MPYFSHTLVFSHSPSFPFSPISMSPTKLSFDELGGYWVELDSRLFSLGISIQSRLLSNPIQLDASNSTAVFLVSDSFEWRVEALDRSNNSNVFPSTSIANLVNMDFGLGTLVTILWIFLLQRLHHIILL